MLLRDFLDDNNRGNMFTIRHVCLMDRVSYKLFIYEKGS